ncbi:MAG: response regulator [Planctomycetes bacterium]|nr:response regulator [Planctomycetota bacterium]
MNRPPCTPSSRPGTGHGARFRALVAAAEPCLRRVIVGQLARAGYCVAEAEDGMTGLARARATHPDVVVIDSALPGAHGIDLCRRLRDLESGSEPYIVLILGPEDESRLIEAIEAGIDDYVSRPFHPWALLSSIAAGERILGRGRPAREGSVAAAPPRAGHASARGDEAGNGRADVASLDADLTEARPAHHLLDRREILLGEPREAREAAAPRAQAQHE